MKKCMYVFVILFAFNVFVGCTTATLVSKPGSVDKYSASNEKNKPGFVKYMHIGAPSVISEKKLAARKLMRKTCKGEYEINKQGLGLLKDDPSYNQYWYYQFSCN